MGLQIDAASPDLAPAMAAGIKTFNVELSANTPWSDVANKFGGTEYFLSVNSKLPGATGVIVQPQFYRLNQVKNGQKLAVNLPGAQRALVIVALSRDGTVISQKMYDVDNGVLRGDLRAAQDADQVALIYPIGESSEMEDLWERLDERRDKVLQQIRSIGTQPGLRGLINPLGTTVQLPSQDASMVPQSPLFKTEFADYLEDKYKNVLSLLRAWNMSAADVETFPEVVELFPLWNNGRGIGGFFDLKQNRIFLAEPKSSSYWKDLADCIGIARSRRVHRVLRAIRKASGVPVFQEWTGWSWFFENPESELSGLAVRLKKFSPSGLMDSVAGALSSNLRSRVPGPLLAVDVPYSPELDQPAVMDDLGSYGIRGLFLKATKPEDLAKIARLQLSPSISKTEARFFPQNATNPAFAQKLAGGVLWLPAPWDGNRVQLGKEISGYQFRDQNETHYVLWNNTTVPTVPFYMISPSRITVTGFGTTAEPPTATKTGMLLALGHNPVLIKGALHCPIPESEIARLDREIAALFQQAEKARRDTSTERIDYRNYQDSLKTDPDRAFALAKKVHSDLNRALTGTLWYEFETYSNNTFSEVTKDAGCSNGASLTVRTPLAEATGLVYAAVPAQPKSSGNLEVWVAARITNEYDRQNLKLKIGGQTMSFKGAPVSPYGSGYAWYSLGVTRLPLLKTDVRAEIIGSPSTDISLDCIVFSPQPFTPNNVVKPEFTVANTNVNPP